MIIRKALITVTLAGIAAQWGLPAQAADFSPTTHFSLSARKVNANPLVKVMVAQDQGEENISKVVIVVPKGFKLPGDAAITNGETLGSGQIKIASEPACDTSSEGTFNATLKERDRTTAEKNGGVKAVWVLDLQFITINLNVYGSSAAGWKVKATVPNSPATCPPFSFNLTVNKTSSMSHKKIFQNPRSPGSYTFKAMWTSDKGTKFSSSQTIKIVA